MMVFCAAAKAQEPDRYYFRDGKFIVGGRVNYIGGGRVVTADHKVENKGFSLSVAPSFGYYINNLMSVGTSVGYERVQDDRGHQNTYSVTPFIRYFFPVKQVFLFVQGESGIGFGRSRLDKGERNRHFIWNSGLKPGFFFNISEHLSAEATFSRLEYRRVWVEDLSSHKKTSGGEWKYQVLDISFGVSYVF